MNFHQADKNRVTPTAARVGKKELCVTLGWSRPQLDRRLAADENFPVLQRGTQGGGWQFDLDVVVAYLARVPAARRPGRRAGSAQRSQDAGGGKSVHIELERIEILRRAIETSVRELGAAMSRLEASLDRQGLRGVDIDVEPDDGQAF